MALKEISCLGGIMLLTIQVSPFISPCMKMFPKIIDTQRTNGTITSEVCRADMRTELRTLRSRSTAKHIRLTPTSIVAVSRAPA